MLIFLSVLGWALADPSVIHFPIHRSNHTEPEPLLKRDLVSANLQNLRTYYASSCVLGTPPQQLESLLDTGSSDFWVLDPNTPVCRRGKCSSGSQFDPSKSSSFHSNNTDFYQEYADSTSANGTWAQDVLSFNTGNSGGSNNTIKNFNFAVANQSTADQPVAGIGLANGETPYILNTISTPYENLPVQLKTNGYISHVAYSLWLNSYSDATGSVLFGGIDRNSVDGDIYTFPMVPVDTDEIDRLAIKMDAMYVMNEDGSQQKFLDCSVAVTLDSGSTLSAMPAELLSPFMQAIGAQYTEGTYLVDCDVLSSNKGGLGLVFGGVEYVVNFRDLAMVIATDDGTAYCVPGFLVSDLPLLGDNVLRSLYVVYDLENKEIGIGKANTASASGSASYEEISTGIPGTKAPGYSDSTVWSTYHTYPIQLNGVTTAKSTSLAGIIPSSGFNTQSSENSSHHIKSGSASATSGGSDGSISITVGGVASQTGIVTPYMGYSSSGGESSGSGSQQTSTSTKKHKNSASKQFAGVSSALSGALGIFILV